MSSGKKKIISKQVEKKIFVTSDVSFDTPSGVLQEKSYNALFGNNNIPPKINRCIQKISIKEYDSQDKENKEIRNQTDTLFENISVHFDEKCQLSELIDSSVEIHSSEVKFNELSLRCEQYKLRFSSHIASQMERVNLVFKRLAKEITNNLQQIAQSYERKRTELEKQIEKQIRRFKLQSQSLEQQFVSEIIKIKNFSFKSTSKIQLQSITRALQNHYELLKAIEQKTDRLFDQRQLQKIKEELLDIFKDKKHQKSISFNDENLFEPDSTAKVQTILDEQERRKQKIFKYRQLLMMNQY